MELPHDREHVEHLPGGVRSLPPVLSAEGALGDLLSRAEAVEDGAAGKAPLPQLGVDAAAEVGLQVGAGLPGGLVSREVGRGGEGQRDTAQSETVAAVGQQVEADGIRRWVSVLL